MVLFVVILIFLAIAASLTWFFLAHDQGEKEPVLALWAAAGFGLLAAVAAGIVEPHLISQEALNQSQPLGSLLLASLGVGLIEETVKFLPLALFIYRKGYFNEHSDGVIYFALAGLGFGIPENILYALGFGVKAGIGRIILTPVFHAATTGMVGYFLIKTKLGKRSLVKPTLALVAVIVLHGLYDFGLSSGKGLLIVLSFMITAGISIGLFILFIRAKELDQAQGLSAVGHNSFCRTCGFPNLEHGLYCTRCGQRA